MADRPSLSLFIQPSEERTESERRGEGSLDCHSLRGSYTQKKANQPKLTTKLTNNQTNHLLQLQRWTVTWSSLCSFCDSWCHNFFLNAFCFPFLFPWLIPPPSLTSMAQWLQAAHPRVEKTALQCTKKSKLNQKCCSWCLFYTVVLLAFLLL